MPGEWRVANSLNVLLKQINAEAPRRSKDADGSIGDLAHQNSVSDHNPDSRGVVRARDFTDDAKGGMDALVLREQLRRSKDPRIKYVISEGQMFSSYAVVPYAKWEWRPYHGLNGHFHHVHVSVVADARADETRAWAIDLNRSPASPRPNLPTAGQFLTEDGIFDAGTCKVFQAFLRLPRTGVWDKVSKQAMQRWVGVTPDGIVGPKTIAALNVKVGRPDLKTNWTRDTTRALEAYLNRGLRAGTFHL